MPEGTTEPRGLVADGLLTRLGRVGFSGERALWVHGRRREDFEPSVPLIIALCEKLTRLDILFTSEDPAVRRWLAEVCPDAVVLAPPLRFARSASRYVLNLNVRAVLFLGRVGPGDRHILRAAYGRAVPAALLQTSEDGGADQLGGLAGIGADIGNLQRCFVTSQAAEKALVHAGLPAGQIIRLAGDAAGRRTTVVAGLVELLRQDLKVMRSTQRPLRRWMERQALGCLDHPRWRRWLSFKVQRFDTLDELQEVLGHPETILCLGNGPSSEGPAVEAVDYDCLFRVNHVWLKRDFLVEPDMVFTGSKSTLVAVRGAIFGLLTVKAEARLLVRHFLRPNLLRVRYAAVERFGLGISDALQHGVRPTNGAVMLATAVSLQPQRLVVSGIDLFSHPAGSYPGDETTPNAYSPGHEADSELALLLDALDQYRGELVILSSALKERWEEHRNGRLARQDAAGCGRMT